LRRDRHAQDRQCGNGDAAERTPAYGQPEAQFAADAASLKAGEIAAMPGRGGFDLVLEDGGKLGPCMMMLGIYCRAWKVANPLSEMVARALGSWDRDGQRGGAPDGPLIRFRATMRWPRCAASRSRNEDALPDAHCDRRRSHNRARRRAGAFGADIDRSRAPAE